MNKEILVKKGLDAQMGVEEGVSRRHSLGLLAAMGGGLLLPGLGFAQQKEQKDEKASLGSRDNPRITEFPPEHGRLRPMKIHQVKELGLEIWTEAEPEWGAGVLPGSPPNFVAQAPDNYHPSGVITISAWRRERVPMNLLETVADTAIRTGAGNYGLNKGAARGIDVKPQTWGILQGYQGDFVGHAQNMRMDVRIFVGQQEGKYPVAAHIYTEEGKMKHLEEVVRRCWSNIKYI